MSRKVELETKKSFSPIVFIVFGKSWSCRRLHRKFGEKRASNPSIRAICCVRRANWQSSPLHSLKMALDAERARASFDVGILRRIVRGSDEEQAQMAEWRQAFDIPLFDNSDDSFLPMSEA